MKNHITRLFLAVALFLVLPLFALAQVTVPAVAPAVSIASPWYVLLLSSGEFWTTAFAIVSGTIAIWKHTDLKASQKVVQSLVLGVESAASSPEFASLEQRLKSTIQTKATEYGVQPLLHRIVQDLTEPAAASGGATDSHT